jgi:hypothetical protein
MNGMMEEVKKILEAKGEAPQINEPTCVIWKADHKTCFGCMSELSCSKFIRLNLAMLEPMMYTPKNYGEFLQQNTRIENLISKILDAKTINELKLIR